MMTSKIVFGRANGFKNRESWYFFSRKARKGISAKRKERVGESRLHPTARTPRKMPIRLIVFGHPSNPTILQSYNPTKEKTTLDEKVVFSINQKNHETFTQLNNVYSTHRRLVNR